MRNWPVRHQRRVRIEIIPMIDVMMFLLVFFVLISVNVLPALGLKITPPSSAQPDKVVERTRVLIGIDREGKTFIDGQPLALDAIAEKLKSLPSDKPTSVVVSGDEGASLQNLISVMDALKSAGVTSMQIVTRPK
ncbi:MULTISPECIES: biopolymer transporter ExbD [unclassified Beijerinckia]|uniref:ExbD/TolR family protein n=1 Tax=unclassified Beijerinckia TaxID=2638183 RepID=UPI000895ACE7|nr:MULTISPECIES: biopolymer transporter ExbD [unclassified Beijerinckia]MDH7794496.1 biopolymer transport protein ExbD [Beijerinckia sp. GAS462]SEB64348.1 outer membrane transport energization protein ExbD [Beijerinckia sp. 28-YEA-48]